MTKIKRLKFLKVGSLFMDYNEMLYNVFSKGEDKLESWMAAVFSKDTDEMTTVEKFKEILSESREFTVIEFEEIDEENFIRDKSEWEVNIKLQYLPIVLDEKENDIEKKTEEIDTLSFYVSLLEANTITADIPQIFSIKTVFEEDYIEACSCKYAIHTSVVFENFPLADYQRQLKLLNLLVPKASIFMDMSCYTAHSGDWLSYTSSFELPPSFDYLYTIHGVYDDDTYEDKVEYWFHTHGLYRVGSIELEIVGVKDSKAEFAELLNTCAKLFIERGVPESGFVFTPAYGVKVTWFPWQEALKKLNISENVLGSAKDRNDNMHNTPSGILVAVDNDGNYHTMDYYKKNLAENPVFGLSNFETAVMREAAYTKLEHFLELLEKNKNDKKISFLVKLGYSENEDNKDDLEHLWFEVHNFKDDNFDATLLNEPYQNLNMHEGDRRTHNINRLTDWTIYTEDASYNSHNIYLLFR